MDIREFSFRLALAFILGALIGFERQWQQKSAGLRTNTLVSVGAAAFILLSLSLTEFQGDPSRVASQIVTGIGFLGAGVIMKDGLSVQGLNTAATIWCSAATGSLAGMGLYVEALIVTGVIILVHLTLRPLSLILSRQHVRPTQVRTEYLLTAKVSSEESERSIRRFLMDAFTKESKVLLRSMSSDKSEVTGLTMITAKLATTSQQNALLETIVMDLKEQYADLVVGWEIVKSETDS